MNKKSKLRLYQWIPLIYMMQGFPFAFVTMVSPVLYKDFNLNNTAIAFYSSIFILPWVCKFLMAPAFEKLNKKKVLLFSQLLISVFILLLAMSIHFIHWYFMNIIFIFIALFGAIYDIQSDGIYLAALSYSEQAKFVGIRTISYQIGKIICRGFLLYIVGFFSLSYTKQTTWSVSFFIVSIIIFLLTPYQQNRMPEIVEIKKEKNSYLQVIQVFFQLKLLLPSIIFILFYELPNIQLAKIIPLYMMDKVANHGLGLGVEEVGLIYGGIGIVSMLIGITLSGFLLNHFSLKKCLLPFTVFTTLGNTVYLFLYYYPSMLNVIISILIAEFAFGLSNGAYMLYIVRFFSRGAYSMSLYAIGTAFMLLSVMIGGSISGLLQALLGYDGFFMWIILISIGTIFISFSLRKKVLMHDAF